MKRQQPEKARPKAEAFSSDVTFIVVTVTKSRGFRGSSRVPPIPSRLSVPMVHVNGPMWTGSMAEWHRSHTSLRLPTSEVVVAAASWLCYGPPWQSQSSFLLLVLAFYSLSLLAVQFHHLCAAVLNGQQISRDGCRDGKSSNNRGEPYTVWVRHWVYTTSSFSQTLPQKSLYGRVFGPESGSMPLLRPHGKETMARNPPSSQRFGFPPRRQSSLAASSSHGKLGPSFVWTSAFSPHNVSDYLLVSHGCYMILDCELGFGFPAFGTAASSASPDPGTERRSAQVTSQC
ncbi:hypothetical protein QBC45DRAFT_430687 [Copromyces sp. CBS 386.78]|nr:hypothetical protein QBC45DRAFT_430687 [Copromyces sp. CBS 386.78]